MFEWKIMNCLKPTRIPVMWSLRHLVLMVIVAPWIQPREMVVFWTLSTAVARYVCSDFQVAYIFLWDVSEISQEFLLSPWHSVILVIGIGSILDFGLDFYLFHRRCKVSTIGIPRVCTGCLFDRGPNCRTATIWRIWICRNRNFGDIGSWIGIPCHVSM